MARRHLGMAPAEWDRLAWWEQRMYLDGYETEGLLKVGSDPAEGGQWLKDEQVHQSGGTTITDRDYTATFDGEPGEMAAFGLTEITL